MVQRMDGWHGTRLPNNQYNFAFYICTGKLLYLPLSNSVVLTVFVECGFRTEMAFMVA